MLQEIFFRNFKISKLEKRSFIPHYLPDKGLKGTIGNRAFSLSIESTLKLQRHSLPLK